MTEFHSSMMFGTLWLASASYYLVLTLNGMRIMRWLSPKAKGAKEEYIDIPFNARLLLLAINTVVALIPYVNLIGAVVTSVSFLVAWYFNWKIGRKIKQRNKNLSDRLDRRDSGVVVSVATPGSFPADNRAEVVMDVNATVTPKDPRHLLEKRISAISGYVREEMRDYLCVKEKHDLERIQTQIRRCRRELIDNAWIRLLNHYLQLGQEQHLKFYGTSEFCGPEAEALDKRVHGLAVVCVGGLMLYIPDINPYTHPDEFYKYAAKLHRNYPQVK